MATMRELKYIIDVQQRVDAVACEIKSGELRSSDADPVELRKLLGIEWSETGSGGWAQGQD